MALRSEARTYSASVFLAPRHLSALTHSFPSWWTVRSSNSRTNRLGGRIPGQAVQAALTASAAQSGGTTAVVEFTPVSSKRFKDEPGNWTYFTFGRKLPLKVDS
jgi:hypothetical protein